MDKPVRVVEFDHRPSDDELAVVFSERTNLSGNRYRDTGDEVRIETAMFPTRTACVFVVLAMAAVVVGGQLTPNPVPTGALVPSGIVLAMFVTGLYAVGNWFNRMAAAANPLVLFDRLNGTLHVEGRAEPLLASQVQEIAVWELSYKNLRELGRSSDDFPACQVVALVGRDDRYYLEFLYQHQGPAEGIGSYPSRRLAQAINVPLRVIRNREQLRDLRPPDRFTKRKR